MNESYLYSFTDQEQQFAINVLDAQQLIADLIINSEIKQSVLPIYRNSILSYLPLLSFIKGNESYALYVDAEKPYLRLKCEVNGDGSVRSLIMTEDGEIPEHFTGKARFLKSNAGEKSFYNSIISIDKQHLEGLATQFLKDSMQIDGMISVSPCVDHSFIIYRLGDHERGIEKEKISVKEFFFRNKLKLQFINEDQVDRSLDEIGEKVGLKFIGKRKVFFNCGCNRERMIKGVRSISNVEHTQLFQNDQGHDTPFILVKCEYCLKNYEITREEIL